MSFINAWGPKEALSSLTQSLLKALEPSNLPLRWSWTADDVRSFCAMHFCAQGSPAYGPDANIVGGDFHDGGQEEIQIYITAKCWSTEWYTVIDHCVYKPKIQRGEYITASISSLSATAFITLVFLWHLPSIPGYKRPVTHLFSSKQIPNITQLLNFPFSTRVIKRLFRVLLFVCSSDVSQYTLSFLDVSLQQQISRRFWDIP